MQRADLIDEEEQAKRQARLDPLTGLGNRRAFDERLDRAIDHARLQPEPLSVIVSDLDDFKEINDSYGHLNGDEVLRTAADAMRAAVRDHDACYRWGGDEFAVLLPGVEQEVAEKVAERVSASVVAPCIRPDGDPQTLAWGTAELAPHMQASDLLASADLALMTRKHKRQRAAPASAAELPDSETELAPRTLGRVEARPAAPCRLRRARPAASSSRRRRAARCRAPTRCATGARRSAGRPGRLHPGGRGRPLPVRPRAGARGRARAFCSARRPARRSRSAFIVLGAVMQMSISRYLAGDAAAQLLPERVKRFDRFIEERGFWAVFYMRLAPAIPYNLVNYGAGLTSLKVRAMAAGHAVGALPRTFAWVALGGNLDDLGSTGGEGRDRAAGRDGAARRRPRAAPARQSERSGVTTYYQARARVLVLRARAVHVAARRLDRRARPRAEDRARLVPRLRLDRALPAGGERLRARRVPVAAARRDRVARRAAGLVDRVSRSGPPRTPEGR